MNNETIVRMYPRPDPKNMECALDLARADEREKMAEDKFAEYFNALQGGEVASAILTQLLRKGVTDDDLRGLRLQWIKDQPQGVEVWVSWDGIESELCNIILSMVKPESFEQGSSTYYTNYGKCHTQIHSQVALSLNIAPGQCRKFRIAEVIE